MLRVDIECDCPAFHFVRFTKIENAFGSAFGDQQALARHAVVLLDDDRKAATLEVEGNFVAFRIAVAIGAGRFQDCGIQRAADSGLELTVEVGQCQGPVGGLSEIIDGGVEDHLSGGQSAGLIAAEDIDGAEILNRGEMLDDDMLAGHTHGAAGESDGGDHGKKLGRQADRQRHGENEGFEGVFVHRDADDEDE